MAGKWFIGWKWPNCSLSHLIFKVFRMVFGKVSQIQPSISYLVFLVHQGGQTWMCSFISWFVWGQYKYISVGQCCAIHHLPTLQPNWIATIILPITQKKNQGEEIYLSLCLCVYVCACEFLNDSPNWSWRWWNGLKINWFGPWQPYCSGSSEMSLQLFHFSFLGYFWLLLDFYEDWVICVLIISHTHWHTVTHSLCLSMFMAILLQLG